MCLGPATIYLARHGESVFNRDKRIAGQLDIPLSAKGIAQSHALERALRTQPLTAIYTSTLKRARDTAVPIASARNLPIREHAALMEMHHGSLQGRYRDERDPDAQTLWAQRARDKLAFAMPDGETYAELEQRVCAALAEITARETGGRILIVGHRHTNRVLLCALLGWNHAEAAVAKPRSRYVYEITPGPKPRVRTLSLHEERVGYVYDGYHC